MNVRYARLLLVLTIFLLSVSCSGCSGERPDYWPTEDWKTSPPGEQGMDPKSLSMIDLQVEENFPNIRGVLVVRNGYLVFENYYRGYGKSDHHHVWSVTKSITSILVGIAFKEGKIEDLHQELPRFFPRYFGPKTDPRKKEITLEHLLTMTSGFDPDGQYREDTRQLMLSENMVRASIEQPLASEPGERFAYNEGNPHLLSAILTKRTDENALGYAHEKLFGPLQRCS